jgi:type I restriction enzyme M protein
LGGCTQGKEAQTKFAYRTSAIQVLFLQHVIESLKENGRYGIVIDKEYYFVPTKTHLSKPRSNYWMIAVLYCIVFLPSGVFFVAST